VTVIVRSKAPRVAAVGVEAVVLSIRDAEKRVELFSQRITSRLVAEMPLADYPGRVAKRLQVIVSQIHRGGDANLGLPITITSKSGAIAPSKQGCGRVDSMAKSLNTLG
jgi:hypothetical protein